jgi:hypothetical protein
VKEPWHGPALQTPVDKKRYYALSGPRLYAIATLDGRFPDLGWHQPGEMGGVWAPPIKLLDGYWLGLRPLSGSAREEQAEITWLSAPHSWRMACDGVTLSYSFPALGLDVERREWVVPDESALVVEVKLIALAGQQAQAPEPQEIACGFFVRSDLHGAWMADERLGWHDGADVATYDEELAAVVLRDTLHPAWTVCVGATLAPDAWQTGDDIWGPERTAGRGTGAALWYRCRVSSAGPAQLSFLIAGPARDSGSARELFARLTEGSAHRRPQAQGQLDGAAPTPVGGLTPTLAEAHRSAGEAFLAPLERCVLISPDLAINEVFAWAKANTARLLLEVPGIGSGVMAGLPDFPWWFGCDTAYGVLPMLPAGQTAAAVTSLRTLAAIGERCDPHGAIPHEVLPYGQIWAGGNLVELPLFLRAVYHTYCWSGDRSLLTEVLPFGLRALCSRLSSSCSDLQSLQTEAATLVPSGSSIVETPEMAAGLPALDVAAYLVEALECLAELAALAGPPQASLAAELRRRAAQTRDHVRAAWWLPQEGLFGDLYASPAELRTLLTTLLSRAAQTPPEGQKALLTSASLLRRALDEHDRQVAPRHDGETEQRPRPWLLHHMVQALALDAGLPDSEQAAQLLRRLETPEWRGPFGIVLNAQSDRQIMTLPSGALAVGAARYGRPDTALDWIRRIAAAFGAASPGTLSEYAPDGGCFLQLWSSYGIVWPVVHYFFGLRPLVAARRLCCVPQLPAAWPQATLRRVPLASAYVDVELTARPHGLQVRLEVSEPGWELLPGVALPSGAHITSSTLNQQPVTLSPVRLTGFEGRTAWTAPTLHGATSYELIVSWSSESGES